MITSSDNPIGLLLRAASGAGDERDRTALGVTAAIAIASAAENGLDVSPRGLHRALREATSRDPLGAVGVTVLGGAYLFFLAEVGQNPKVTTYWDALVFVSTSLSVGYADVFARTPAGKAIASALMTFGPALSGAALEGPEAAPVPDEALKVQRAILDKLDAILGEMKRADAVARVP